MFSATTLEVGKTYLAHIPGVSDPSPTVLEVKVLQVINPGVSEHVAFQRGDLVGIGKPLSTPMSSGAVIFSTLCLKIESIHYGVHLNKHGVAAHLNIPVDIIE